MAFSVERTLKRLNRSWKERQVWYRITLVLASLTVFFTTYALILPAITMDDDAAAVCGYLSHRHDESCYAEDGELICPLPEHEHDMACYAEHLNLQPSPYICGHDYEHEHTEDCFIGDTLICTLTEHTHTEDCLPTEEDPDDAVRIEPILTVEADDVITPVLKDSDEVEAETDAAVIDETDEAEPETDAAEEIVPVTDEADGIEPETEEETDEETEEEAETAIVTVESEAAWDGASAVVTGLLPENAAVTITPVILSEAERISYFGEEKAAAMIGYAAYDITIYDGDGAEWQPDEAHPVSVTVLRPDLEVSAGESLEAAHIDGETDEVTEVAVTLEESGDVTFEADSFSMYVFFTVDFHYDGGVFSIEGMTEILLSDLFRAIGVEADTADVTDVSFTDPALLAVTELDGDWLLTSLAPFETEEALSVTFSTGEVLDITVTDAISGTYGWERVSSIDSTTDYYIIVEKDSGMAFGTIVNNIIGYITNVSSTATAVTLTYDTDTGLYALANDPGGAYYWTFGSTGSSGTIYNHTNEAYLSFDEDDLVHRQFLSSSITNTYTYDNSAGTFTINEGSRYLCYNNGFTKGSAGQSGTNFYIYKRVSTVTTHSSNTYTIPVFMVKVNSNGDVLSKGYYSTITISTGYTQSSPFVPENLFNTMGMEDSDFVRAYYGTDGNPDRDNVTALYVKTYTTGRWTTTTHYPLGITADGVSEDRYLDEAGSSYALFIEYKDRISYGPPLPATGGQGTRLLYALGVTLLLAPVWYAGCTAAFFPKKVRRNKAK